MCPLVLQKFGGNIRSIRLKKGLSQEKLAELSGLHRTYIGGVERGERNISLINLVRLAKALDIPIDTLVKDIEE